MSDRPHILMCRPDFYGIEYEINPWMNRERQVDHDLAISQWENLRTILESIGVKIDVVEPQPRLPDLTFTANAAIVFGTQAVLSRFRHAQRQGEEPHFAAKLRALQIDVVTMPDDLFFEGAGDALFCGETLFGGYRMRSTATSLQRVGKIISREVIPLELVDSRFYHLDTCFCPVNPDLAIWFPAAFDTYGQDVIQSTVSTLIEIDETEAASFGANAVVVGNRVITNTGCRKLHAQLKASGLDSIETPLNEFIKAGGSAKCLTLRLDGEDAASWKLSS